MMAATVRNAWLSAKPQVSASSIAQAVRLPPAAWDGVGRGGHQCAVGMSAGSTCDTTRRAAACVRWSTSRTRPTPSRTSQQREASQNSGVRSTSWTRSPMPGRDGAALLAPVLQALVVTGHARDLATPDRHLAHRTALQQLDRGPFLRHRAVAFRRRAQDDHTPSLRGQCVDGLPEAIQPCRIVVAQHHQHGADRGRVLQVAQHLAVVDVAARARLRGLDGRRATREVEQLAGHAGRVDGLAQHVQVLQGMRVAPDGDRRRHRARLAQLAGVLGLARVRARQAPATHQVAVVRRRHVGPMHIGRQARFQAVGLRHPDREGHRHQHDGAVQGVQAPGRSPRRAVAQRLLGEAPGQPAGSPGAGQQRHHAPPLRRVFQERQPPRHQQRPVPEVQRIRDGAEVLEQRMAHQPRRRAGRCPAR